MNIFRDSYEYYPGDIPNAYDYFDGSGGNTVCGADGSGDSDCNGDGNNIIDGYPTGEVIKAWQHLSLADLIKGSYVGDDGSTKVGINVPKAILNSGYMAEAGYIFEERTNGDSTIKWGSISGATFSNAVVSPVNAKKIDRKMDDGVASSGKVLSSRGANLANFCQPYDLSKTNPLCIMLFILE